MSAIPAIASPNPDHVKSAPRSDNGDSQRAHELERHRQAERDADESLVKQQVHDADRDAVRNDCAPLCRRKSVDTRAEHRKQDDRGQDNSNRRGPCHADERKDAFRDRGAACTLKAATRMKATGAEAEVFARFTRIEASRV